MLEPGILSQTILCLFTILPILYSQISLTLPVGSHDKSKSIRLKGRLVDSYESGLSALSVIIHQATYGNIR